jgi:fructokinase
MTPALLGAIEAGGTKFVCAVGRPSGELVDETRVPTGAPADTMEQVFAFFRNHAPVAAIGIGAFGPLQLDRRSPQFGFITNTPKTAWRQFDLLGSVRRALQIPVVVDTDVNAAALAEARWGAAAGFRTFMYVTVGTGIGAALLVGGKPFQGLTHPEMGHIRIPHDVSVDPFPGVCPYHGDCLEGLASGPALEARWKTPPSALPFDHPAWAIEADYLALACANWICTLSPERIVLGGGVMVPELFASVRSRVERLLNNYIDVPELAEGLEQYILPSSLQGRSGVLGALILAAEGCPLPPCDQNRVNRK